ncbi:MAG: endolytic transglycosylase MltG [Clostridia bacterium]|nr:endolytic transglycosylase MltG [Clostridia bacterium]
MAFDADKELEALMANVNAEDKKSEQQVHFVNDEVVSDTKKDDTEYYSGEVYFAARKPAHTVTPAQPQRPARPAQNRREQIHTGAPVMPTRRPQRTGKRYSSKTRRTARGGAVAAEDFTIGEFIKQNGTKGAIIYVAVLVAISAIMSVFLMSFVNDIFGFNRSDKVITVKVSENMSTGKLINQFKKQGLIKRKGLCKMFMVVAGGMHKSTDFETYLSGVYDLKPSMGLEKMLLSCQEEQKSETVTVTIPEGFNIEQIALKLEKAEVCTAADFYSNLESATFEYDFLKGIENKSSRYNYLEGYLYPDTYEFYVGQSASSVIRKLLENTDKKWTAEYEKQAKAMGMSMDEVITMASIIQKEAGDAEQMPIIASVFYNRLKSSSFRCLQSDATTVYVAKFIKPNVSVGEADTFAQKYDTYKCIGLPAGPICCPGDDAIKAVLWPADTDYYFFGHDSSGNMYAAKTEAERNAMMYKAVVGTDEDDG